MTHAYRSRWGYHPCDYETYLLLKKLNQLYLRALSRFAAWKRWQRKRPHNRVRRRAVVDEHGRRVGSRVVGPRPEPELDAAFIERTPVIRHGGERSRAANEAGERVRLLHGWIPEAYRSARTPAAQPDAVTPLPCPTEEIRRLTEAAERGVTGG